MPQIAHYTFDDTPGSGTLADSAGPTSEDGVLQGDATTDGTGAGQFDGDGDYAEIPADPLFGLSEGTIAMSFTQAAPSIGNNPHGDTPAMTLFSVDSRFNDDGGHLTLFITSSGQIEVRHQTDTSTFTYAGGNVVVGEPTTVAYSWGPGGSQLVVNGVVVDTGTVPLTMAGDVEPIVIGASQASSGDGVANNLQGFFQGEISDVQIYDEAAASPAPMMCFTAGTLINTPSGSVPVEVLTAGDVVWTCDHGPLPLTATHRRTVSTAQMAVFANLRPVRIALSDDGSDLLVSRQHCIAVWNGARQVLVRAAHLERFGGNSFTCEMSTDAITFVHLEFAVHALVMANGVLTESLVPGAPALTGRAAIPGARPCRKVLTGSEARAMFDHRAPLLVRPEVLTHAM